MPEIIAEYVDRAVTVECRPRGLPRGVIHRLYQAARDLAGRPLSLAAAEGVLEHVPPGGTFILLTGAGVGPWLPFGESDGPPGAAALARTLHLTRGALPVVLCTTHQVPPVRRALEAAGFVVTDLATARSRRFAGVVEGLSVEEPVDAAGLLDRYKPRAVVAIERLGPNHRGVMHSILGHPLGAPDVDFSSLLRAASAQDIFTVGIGDGGNELGFGQIADAVRDIQPFGRHCRCPCAEGIAAEASTDALVVAAVSNWGAYAVAAMLAALTGTPDAFHTPDLEARVILECVRAGGADGGSGELAFSVDGIDGAIHQGMVGLLGQLVRTGLQERHRDF